MREKLLAIKGQLVEARIKLEEEASKWKAGEKNELPAAITSLAAALREMQMTTIISGSASDAVSALRRLSVLKDSSSEKAEISEAISLTAQAIADCAIAEYQASDSVLAETERAHVAAETAIAAAQYPHQEIWRALEARVTAYRLGEMCGSAGRRWWWTW
jgi:hypothetical protein